MLPLRARVDLGAIAMKGYSKFPKAPALLEAHYQIVILDTRWGGSYPPPSKVQSVYSTAPAECAYFSRFLSWRVIVFIWVAAYVLIV